MSLPGQARSVCVLGGSGFVGSALCEQLVARGWHVRVLTRDRQQSRHLFVLPTVEVVVADPYDDAVLVHHFEGMDAVVNLVAVLHDTRGGRYKQVHLELPRKVANACRGAGVGRLVHMSALGASENAPSEYLRTRGQGEQVVREAAEGLEVTILRPSIIFGPGDSFLNLFARLARFLPVIPLAGAGARFQPIWVEDVARVICVALENRATAGRTYELGGPRTYSLREIVAWVAALTGHARTVIGLPDKVARWQAAVLERLPGPLMTRDNLLSMSVDNVCTGPVPAEFGFEPSATEAVVPGYLAPTTTWSRSFTGSPSSASRTAPPTT